MKKISRILVLTLVALFTSVTMVFAAAGLVDSAQTLNKDDAQKITTQLEALNKKYNISIGILIMPNLKGQEIDKFAKEYFAQNKYGAAANGGIVLVIDKQTKKTDIITDKKISAALTPEVRKELSKNVNAALKNSKNPAAACIGFLNKIDEQENKYQQNKPAKPAAEKAPGQTKSAAKAPSKLDGPLGYIIALIGGAAAAFLHRNNLRAQMSNVHEAAEASEYVTEDGLQLSVSRDEYDHTNYVRTALAAAAGAAAGAALSEAEAAEQEKEDNNNWEADTDDSSEDLNSDSGDYSSGDDDSNNDSDSDSSSDDDN